MNEKIKAFLGDSRVKAFFWNALGTFLGLVAVYLGELDPKYEVAIIPTILLISKYINKKYL